MPLLDEKTTKTLDLEAEELLLLGSAWRERVGRENIDLLQAPPLYLRTSTGSLQYVESEPRARRLRDLLDKGTSPGLSPGMAKFELAMLASNPIHWSSFSSDSSGVGTRSHLAFELTTDGLFYYRSGIPIGWSPDRETSEVFWLLDGPDNLLRDFSELAKLHRSIRQKTLEPISDRWLWDQVLAWIRTRVKSSLKATLSQHLERAFAAEPRQWEVALLVEGVQLSDNWQADFDPLSLPWFGERIVDGRFLVGKMLDALLPDRDPELFEKSEVWLESEGPHRAVVDNYDWLLFSPRNGDRHAVLERCLREASHLCGLISLFDGTNVRAELVPSALRNRGELCVVLFPVPSKTPFGSECEPVFLDGLPRPFLSSPKADEVLHLDVAVGETEVDTFKILSKLSSEFQALRNQGGVRTAFGEAILQTIRRLARARREPDDHERLFLLVSALDALLVGKPPSFEGDDGQSPRRKPSSTQLFRSRFAILATSEVKSKRSQDAARVAKKAYYERSAFAHGSAPDEMLNEADRTKFESWTTEIARTLFLSASSFESLDEFRARLDEGSTDTLRNLRSLDEVAEVSRPMNDTQPN